MACYQYQMYKATTLSVYDFLVGPWGLVTLWLDSFMTASALNLFALCSYRNILSFL